MLHVDDLIEPRTEKILFASLPPLPWPHCLALRSVNSDRANHGCRLEGIEKSNLQENCRPDIKPGKYDYFVPHLLLNPAMASAFFTGD
jgi:hypothetical protein